MDYSRNNSFRSRRRQRFGKRDGGKNFKFLALIIIIFVVSYFIYNSGSSEKEAAVVAGVAAPEVLTEAVSGSPPSPIPAKRYKTLQETIEKSLEGSTGTYGVYVKNLKTGESYSYNDNKIFEAGSLYKLWTMAVVISQIESGDLEEDDELSQSVAVLNRKFSIDPDSAEQTQGNITLTVKDALIQMITISHNYAALLLTEKIKLSTVAAWLEAKGFNNSKVGTDGDSPTTTPLDIALFYERLYKGELGNAKSTTKMIDLLKAQQLNNKLPLNLPSGTIVAHKTGELGWFTHDAGIVYTEKGDYLIVAMSESSSPPGAEERIADLSLNIFNYFKNK